MLINIQFLRFAAALLVVMFHAGAYLPYAGHELGALFNAAKYTGFGGVDVFFVISGFIMVWSTTNEDGAVSAFSFFKRRIARIYAGYWPFFLIYLAAFYFTEPARLVGLNLLGSFTLWPTPVTELLVSVSWTLVFEMYFYVLFTILIAVAGKQRDKVIPIAFCMVLAWTFYSYCVRNIYNPEAFDRLSYYETYLASPYLLQFLGGAILANWLRDHSTGRAWPYIAAGVLFWILAGLINANLFEGGLTRGDLVFWRAPLFGIPAVLILIGLVKMEFSGRAITPRASVLLGGSSYALYLSHPLLLHLAQTIFGLNWKYLKGTSELVAQGTYLLLVAAIVMLSVIHYKAIERPLHALFKKLLGIGQRSPNP